MDSRDKSQSESQLKSQPEAANNNTNCGTCDKISDILLALEADLEYLPRLKNGESAKRKEQLKGAEENLSDMRENKNSLGSK